MSVTVPSLEGKTYLKDPQSVIAYIIRRYGRTPANAVPMFGDRIISLSYQISRFGRDPDTLTSNIQNDLGGAFSRIFDADRLINVLVTYEFTSDSVYDITVTVSYAMLSGEIAQQGATISLNKDNGRLVIPEDTLNFPLA